MISEIVYASELFIEPITMYLFKQSLEYALSPLTYFNYLNCLLGSITLDMWPHLSTKIEVFFFLLFRLCTKPVNCKLSV